MCWALSSRLRFNHLVFILYGLGLASFITVLVFAANVARNLIAVKMPGTIFLSPSVHQCNQPRLQGFFSINKWKSPVDEAVNKIKKANKQDETLILLVMVHDGLPVF